MLIARLVRLTDAILLPTQDMSSGVRGIRDAIILVLSTSFTFGAVVALILNLIIPMDSSNPVNGEDRFLCLTGVPEKSAAQAKGCL